MIMPRYAIHAMLSLWLLAAPTVQAEQQATLYVTGPPSAAAGAGVSCLALKGAHSGNAAYQGCVRRFCDAAWRRTAEGPAVVYADYMHGCARASDPVEPAVTADGIPRLIELAYIAAPGVGASTAAGGAPVAAGTGIGLSTVLVPVAVVGAIGAGVAAAASSSPADKPASP